MSENDSLVADLRKRGRRKIFLYALGVTVLVILIALGVFFAINSDSEEPRVYSGNYIEKATLFGNTANVSFHSNFSELSINNYSLVFFTSDGEYLIEGLTDFKSVSVNLSNLGIKSSSSISKLEVYFDEEPIETIDIIDEEQSTEESSSTVSRSNSSGGRSGSSNGGGSSGGGTTPTTTCTSNLVNTTWTEWVNQSECVDDLIMQNRNSVQYDLGGCVENKTLWDYQNVSCSTGECVPTKITCDANECELIDNGCGVDLDCGSCGVGESCVSNVCLVDSFCGDGECNGDETCGGSDTGDECNSDCGACSSGDAIIINHTAVDEFDAGIPQYYIDEVKKMFVSQIGESHNRGHLYGLDLVEQSDSNFAVNLDWSGSIESYTDQNLRISRTLRVGSAWDTLVGEENTWTSPSAIDGINNHLSYLNQTLGEPVDVFGWGWCWDMSRTPASSGVDSEYGVHWYGSSVGSPNGNLPWGLNDADNALTGNSVNMDTYISAWENIEANNPNTLIVYATGPVDHTNYNDDEQGYQRYIKNQYIRAYANINGKVLFDYADILTHNNLGVQNNISWNGHSYPYIHPDNAPVSGDGYDVGDGPDHISEEGTLRVGKAFWVMLAKLNGWDGTPACTSGSCNPGYLCNATTELCEYDYSTTSTTTSIEQYGITWTFAEPVIYGQFVNGDYWVTSSDGGGVVITSISPDPANGRNGFVVNPNVGDGQPFDSRLTPSVYGPVYDSSLQPTLPLTISVNSSVVSSISNPEASPCTTASQPGFRPPWNPGGCSISYIRTAAVLTILDSPIENNTYFRPPYIGENKELIPSENIHPERLPSLPPSENVISFESLNQKMGRMQLDYQSPGTPSRRTHPTENMEGYGAEISRDYGDALLRLMLNDSYGDKEELLNYMIQIGIDNYGLLSEGYAWFADGGHEGGRKSTILFAGYLLNDSEMLSIGSDYLETNGRMTFQEDGQSYYDDDTNYVFYYGDYGLPRYGERHTLDPLDCYHNSDYVYIAPGCRTFVHNTYKGLNYPAYMGSALTMRILNLEEEWNHQAFFDMVDRFVNEGNNYINEDGSVCTWTRGSDFAISMWDLYREDDSVVDDCNNGVQDRCSVECDSTADIFDGETGVDVGGDCGLGAISIQTASAEPNFIIRAASAVGNFVVTVGQAVGDVAAWVAESVVDVFTGGENGGSMGDVESDEDSQVTSKEEVQNTVNETTKNITEELNNTPLNKTELINETIVKNNVTTENENIEENETLPIEITIPEDYVGYWSLDSSSVGDIFGDATYSRGVLELDGDGDYIDLGNSPAFSLNGEFSIGAWVYKSGNSINTFGKTGTILGKEISSNTGYVLEVHDETKEDYPLYVRCIIPGVSFSGKTTFYSNNQIEMRRWQHIFCTYDGENARIYIDGVEDSSSTASGSISVGEDSLKIGYSKGSGNSNNYWNGSIDEVLVYNRALTAEEIEEVYCSQGGDCA